MRKDKNYVVKKAFEDLTIIDNYMFQAVMRDPKNVKPLLEMVIGKKISKIVVVEQEKTVETGYGICILLKPFVVGIRKCG